MLRRKGILAWRDLVLCVTWLTHMRDIAHYTYARTRKPYARHCESYVCHYKCARTRQHIHMHHTNSYICTYELIHMELIINVHELVNAYICIIWTHIHVHTNLYMWNALYLCVTVRIVHVRELDLLRVYEQQGYYCVTWLSRTCNMTHPYVRHDSCMCVTWLIHMCDMTHLCVWHDSSICATWLIYVCDMTHLDAGTEDRFTKIHTYIRTHTHTYIHTHIHTYIHTHTHTWTLSDTLRWSAEYHFYVTWQKKLMYIYMYIKHLLCVYVWTIRNETIFFIYKSCHIT